MNKKLNHLYSMNTFFYLSLIASMLSFVSVFLLDKGFSNSTIGTVLSVSSLLAILIQSLEANFLDKYSNFRLQDGLLINVLIILFGSILLLFTSNPLILVLFILLIFSIAQASETLINSLAFVFEKFGIQINYGVGRGIGSLAFAITTLIVGNIVNRTSPGIIPLFYILFSTALLIAVRSYKHPQEKEINLENSEQVTTVSKQSFLHFISQYKRLLLVVIGISFVMFMHILINNFFIQILLPIGGNTATMGNAIFLGAIVELPAMFNYKKIENRFSAGTLLKIAALFFVLKHLLTYFATNMLMIYIAQFIQIGGYALMYPAGVSYVHSVVSEKDLVKGQALFTSAIALSSIAGNFFGGILLDSLGVSDTLFIGIIVTLIGTGIIFFGAHTPSLNTQNIYVK